MDVGAVQGLAGKLGPMLFALFDTARPRVLAMLLGAFLLGLLGAARALTPIAPLNGPYALDYVVDGDTIRVLINGRSESVRLIGIDTPETKDPNRTLQPFGPEASAFTTRLLAGKRVWLERDVQERDRYDRLLAYVYYEDPDGSWTANGRRFAQANLRIALSGLADLLTIPPDVQYAELYLYAVRTAREAGRGMWGAPVPRDSTTRDSGSEATVRIKCVFYNPAGVDDGKEVVTLEVLAAVDTSGWTIHDDASTPHVFALPSRSFNPGDIITVPNHGKPVWNNNGDTVTLVDRAGGQVDTLRYPGGGKQSCR